MWKCQCMSWYTWHKIAFHLIFWNCEVASFAREWNVLADFSQLWVLSTYVSCGFLGIGSLIPWGASVLTDDLNLAIPTSFSPASKNYSCWPWWFGCETAMENVMGSLHIFNGTFKTIFQALSWICAMNYQRQNAHNSTPYQQCQICHAFACNETISRMSPKTSLSRGGTRSIAFYLHQCSNMWQYLHARMHVIREIDCRSDITTCKKWGRVKWDEFYELEELIDYFFQYPMVFNYKIRGLHSRKAI